MTPGEFTRTRQRADIDTLKAMWPEMRSRAFAVQGIDDFARLQRIQEAVAGLSEGGSWNELRGRIAAEIGGDDAAATRRHAETVLRTNGFQAFSSARYRRAQASKSVYKFWKYVTMDDGNVRDAHAELDGVILPADDPFWADHYPPWDFNCRCIVIELTPEDAKDEVEAGEGSMWSEGTRQDWMARNRGRDSTREFHNRPGSLEIDVRDLAAAKGRSREDMKDFLSMMEGRRVGTGEFGADGKERETNVREWLWQPVRRDYHGKALDQGRKDGKEHAYVLDAYTGAQIARVDGTRDKVSLASVPWSPVEKAVIHNHTSGNQTLSPKDLIAAMRADIERIDAVGATGWSRVRCMTKNSEVMGERLADWSRRFEAAGLDPAERQETYEAWLKWLAAQARYGYIQIDRGDAR